MSKAYVFLANGFEEIEALAVVDLLRRGGVELTTVSIGASPMLEGRSSITVKADAMFDEISMADADLLVLPGGMPGTRYLGEHEGLKALLLEADRRGTFIAAICAAPAVLGRHGLLKGLRATCYPGMEEGLSGADVVTDEEVVRSGHIITSRGAGTAIPFGIELIRVLEGDKTADSVAKGIVFRQ